MLSSLRAKLNGDVLALCAIIFLADVTSGIVSPTFSLFAQGLGVSLALLGLLSTLGGVTQVLTSLPFGMLSDRVGRPRVLLGGLSAFVLSLLVMASAHGLLLLLVSRVLMGAGMAALFQIAAAHLGDITEPAQRPFAFGLSTTAMGTGFTIGPLIGSQLAENQSARLAYVVGALISLAGVALAWRLHRKFPNARRSNVRLGGFGSVRAVLADRHLMLASFGSLLMSFTFAGAITTFFPIYGSDIRLTESTIGAMFAVRALVSTLGRLPNGIVTQLFGNQAVMLTALGLDLAVMFGIAHTTDSTRLLALLGADGLAFGAYLVSGQTFVADQTRIENRGTANGVYSTASSVGSMAGPLILGLIASSEGVRTVFTVTGWALVGGLVLSLLGTLALRRRAEPLAPAPIPSER